MTAEGVSRTVTFTPPGEIDAEPAEVGALALAEIEPLLLAAVRAVEEATTQVRSSYLSQVLDEDPNANPVALGRAWEESLEAGACVRLEAAATTSLRLCRSLRARVES